MSLLKCLCFIFLPLTYSLLAGNRLSRTPTSRIFLSAQAIPRISFPNASIQGSCVKPYLGFLEIMALQDPACSSIQDHQQRIPVSVLSRQLERYCHRDASMATASILPPGFSSICSHYQGFFPFHRRIVIPSSIIYFLSSNDETLSLSSQLECNKANGPKVRPPTTHIYLFP
ncbi:hypothetical protein CPC08DRAFT_266774 [Agrocybe pediades]|nr:hypothetical protein CPC08DRAFT_266774 [Agrocybe pediades]